MLLTDLLNKKPDDLDAATPPPQTFQEANPTLPAEVNSPGTFDTLKQQLSHPEPAPTPLRTVQPFTDQVTAFVAPTNNYAQQQASLPSTPSQGVNGEDAPDSNSRFGQLKQYLGGMPSAIRDSLEDGSALKNLPMERQGDDSILPDAIMNNAQEIAAGGLASRLGLGENAVQILDDAGAINGKKNMLSAGRQKFKPHAIAGNGIKVIEQTGDLTPGGLKNSFQYNGPRELQKDAIAKMQADAKIAASKSLAQKNTVPMNLSSSLTPDAPKLDKVAQASKIADGILKLPSTNGGDVLERLIANAETKGGEDNLALAEELRNKLALINKKQQ